MNTDGELAWIEQPLPDVRQNETALDSGSLAKFKDILRFASQYWGGVGALLIAMLLILVLILVVTNDALYNWVREYVIRTDAALSAGAWASFAKRIFAVLAVLAAGVVMYQGLLRYTKIGAERIHAWGLSFLVLLLATINVKIGVELIEWSGVFWEDVKNKNVAAFIPGLVWFAKLAFAGILVGVYRIFFSQLLQIRWRTWLTEQFSERYFSHNRFYHLEQIHGQDNPDQRIAEDLNRLTDMAIGLFFGFYLASLSVYEYSKAMLKLSGDLDTTVFGHAIHIPDYMFWAVIVYTLIGSVAIHFIGRRLVKINVLRERYNADFRYHLIRAREYAEGISFLQGDAHHLRGARHFFTIIRANWYHYMHRIKALGFSQTIYAQVGIIFPVIVAVPRYFSGQITFGAIMQVLRAFGELRESLSWFIDNYSTWAELRGSSTRIFNLDKDLNRVDQLHAQSNLHVAVNNVCGVALTHATLARPQKTEDGRLSELPQVVDLDWQITQGERWLVTGASGSGKSTILRAVAHLWPFGQGHIDVPSKGKMLFLPQKPYMPIGSLREALSYPDAPERFNEAAYETALEMAQLSHLKTRLDEHNNWSWLLSGGEQQRLSFARLFLQRPQYVFLDEATSALDEENEKTLYQTMLAFLPDMTLVSVSHHPQLTQFHHKRLHLEQDGAGSFKPIQSVI
ncbi:MAG: ABC transporter ATP-binding protein/permease [Burkholderiaceae bacterium]